MKLQREIIDQTKDACEILAGYISDSKFLVHTYLFATLRFIYRIPHNFLRLDETQ